MPTVLSCLFSILVICIWCTSIVAQDEEIRSWRQHTLDLIEQQIPRDTTGVDRALADNLREPGARYDWLSGWNPGKMTTQSTNDAPLPEKRTEPVMESAVATSLRASWPGGTDAEIFQVLKGEVSRNCCDPAVIQLYLHWLDGPPARRKRFLAEIESVARHLICLLEQSLLSDPDEQIRLVLEFTRYRRARALVYRELPDVVASQPIVDQALLDQQIQSAFTDLIRESGRGRSEFILLEIRMHRRAGNYGLALQLLEKYGRAILPKWYQKKRRDLLRELNWQPPAREAAAIFAENYPDEVAREAAGSDR